jgi:hypothetical protein
LRLGAGLLFDVAAVDNFGIRHVFQVGMAMANLIYGIPNMVFLDSHENFDRDLCVVRLESDRFLLL